MRNMPRFCILIAHKIWHRIWWMLSRRVFWFVQCWDGLKNQILLKNRLSSCYARRPCYNFFNFDYCSVLVRHFEWLKKMLNVLFHLFCYRLRSIWTWKISSSMIVMEWLSGNFKGLCAVRDSLSTHRPKLFYSRKCWTVANSFVSKNKYKCYTIS